MPAPKKIIATLLILVGLIITGLAYTRSFQQPTEAAKEQLRTAASQRTLSKLDQLIWDYQEMARRGPKDANARAVLGLAYIQKARETADPSYYAKAEQVFDEALRINPQHIDALVGSGSLALSRHQFREALAIAERTQRIYPQIARVYGILADAQIELGMYDQAVVTIQTMVDLRPDLSSYSRVAYARELYGDLDGAIEAMQQAVRAGGPALENVEWTRVQLGNLYLTKHDLVAAEEIFQTSLRRDPTYVFALAGLARVRYAQGQAGQAIELYQQAIQYVPLPEFVIALGEVYQAEGMQPEAEQQYQLVRVMQQLFRSAEVDTDLELALFEADHGSNPAATIAMARKAYERRPGIKAAETLAWALYQAGDHQEARGYIDRALQLGTQDAALFYRAGMIAQAQGDLASARTYLQAALDLNPAFSPLHGIEAQQALEALKQ
jgi:tetratricopeptide (TPR) repeat protein